jgi:hypothetical protein
LAMILFGSWLATGKSKSKEVGLKPDLQEG